MRHQRPNIFERSDSVLAAWYEQVATASKMPLLSRLFAQSGDELFPRFAASYEELRALPRRTRRALQRRLARSRELTRLVKDRMHAHAGRALQHKLAWSLAGAALLLALGQNVHAADITVNTTKPDIVADANCSLIEAIVTANTDVNFDACVRVGGAGADTIILSGGNHALTQINNGVNGLPLITSQITIQGNGATISRKKGPTLFRLFEITTGTLTLNNVKLSGGSSPLGGGAVFNNGGTLTITNSTITGNVAAGGGGGVLNNNGNVTIQNNTISKNTASYGGGLFHFQGNFTVENSTIATNNVSGYGGGIYNSAGTFTLTDSTVSGNKVTNNVNEAFGGGITNYGTLTVQNSLITKNVASSPLHGGYGGGISNFGTATVSYSTISLNTASSTNDDAAGGGIQNCGTLTVENSHITKNTAKTTDPNDNSNGGGVNNGGGPNECSGTATVTNSTISLNKAEYGAGIYNDAGTMTIENSTISSNKANVAGGAIYNDTGATLTVENATITKNTAKFGGGIFNDVNGNLTLIGTLISGNKAPSGDGPEVFAYAPFVANNFNLFGSNNNAGVDGFAFVLGGNDIVPGPGVTTPKILSPALTDNGGPTPTHALVPGSPAIDASSCINPFDQRGVARPVGGACDIGSFEGPP
jgi:Right handed beta helix region